MHMIYDDCVETVHISMEGCLHFGEPRGQEAFFPCIYFFFQERKAPSALLLQVHISGIHLRHHLAI